MKKNVYLKKWEIVEQFWDVGNRLKPHLTLQVAKKSNFAEKNTFPFLAEEVEITFIL